MVVNNLHVIGVPLAPAKADPPSIVDPSTVLTAPIARQLLEPVPGRNAKVAEALSGVKDQELLARCPEDIVGQASGWEPVKNELRVLVPEALDHAPNNNA
jgi:hypothetical protein